MCFGSNERPAPPPPPPAAPPVLEQDAPAAANTEADDLNKKKVGTNKYKKGNKLGLGGIKKGGDKWLMEYGKTGGDK